MCGDGLITESWGNIPTKIRGHEDGEFEKRAGVTPD